jgi:SAM-dependent methyltransferase
MSRLGQRLFVGQDAYGDNFWSFHDTGDWDSFARVVLTHYPKTRSIVDVGCGAGLALSGFARVAPALRLLGIDESPAALARATAAGLRIERFDMFSSSCADLARLASELASFDLALCLEVVEHLPVWHLDKALSLVTAVDRIVFSAAHPNQGGRFHVNEQPVQYWIDRLAARGFVIAQFDAAFRRDVEALDLPWWYSRNVHVFERRT